MKAYIFRVMETVTVEKEYVIEASSPEEAEDLALAGETVGDELVREHGVINREIILPTESR